ncbi:MAG: helix-hairpin-helix domain-containing protein [bacterium]
MVFSSIILGSGIVYFLFLPQPPPGPQNIPVREFSSSDTENLILARVKGSGIVNPGSYRLNPDSSIIDLIEEAGGLKPDALIGGYDLTQSLHDGMNLVIPSRDALEKIKTGERVLTNEDLLYLSRHRERSGDTGVIDLNTAGHWELQSLPGIGPVMAQRIIEYRKKKGRFKSVDQLNEITGIGEVTLKQLKPLVTAR